MVARLLDLENGGLLDLTRLSGQRLPRVLAMVVAGTSWPYVMVSAAFIGLHIWIDGDLLLEFEGCDEATPGMVSCPLCHGHGEVEDALAREFYEVWNEEGREEPVDADVKG